MKKAKAIRVLCVDDHPVVRDGLISIIGAQPDMRVIDDASDGREAITKYRQHQLDVVVMDL
jgi:YesN/AraC family two-component response regulator